MTAAAAFAGASQFCAVPSDVVHAAAVPIFLAYVVLIRPGWLRRVSARHVVYSLVLLGLVAAYLLASGHLANCQGARWGEVPIVLWFLASVHIVVGLIDHTANRALSALFRLAPDDRKPRLRYVPKTALRTVVVLAVAGPYLTGTFLTHWVKTVDGTDPVGRFGAYCEKHEFASTNGRSMTGWFVRSPQARSDATVILLPGRTQSRAAALAYAGMLRECGYNVFLFDYCTDGSSGGHTRSLGVLEAHDVLGAVRWLRRFRPAESRRIFGFGISDGAAAIAHAATMDGRIQAVVLDSALAEGHWLLDGMGGVFPRPVAAYFRNAALLVASAELGCNLFDAGLARSLARLGPRPAMLVHGLKDTVSPPDAQRRLCAGAGGQAALWLVPEAGHAESLLLRCGEYRGRVEALFEPVRRAAADVSAHEQG